MWLYKVDQLFAMNAVAFDQKVRVASIHLEGEAIAWHRSYMRSRSCVDDPSWTVYILALNEKFGEEFEDSMEALKNLTQTSSVKEYQAEFDRLLTYVNLSNENTISYFLGGQKPELNKSTRMQSPRTLLHAYKLARLQEDVFDAQAKTWGLKPMVRPVHGPIIPTPTHVKLPFSKKPFTPNPTYRKPVDSQVAKPNRFTGNGLGRRLTAAEIDEKRAKGLCFFCDDKYVGTTFASDFLLLPLGNVDIVLGSRTIEFRYQGKKHVLRGASSQLKSTRDKSINKVEVDETQFFMMSLLFGSEDRLQSYNIHADQGNLVHPTSSLLIDQYAIIFEIPTTLPPHRGSFDHRIPLVESANPVNKRPYKYPGVKKDIIEKLTPFQMGSSQTPSCRMKTILHLTPLTLSS
ncbi:hypothetical protein KY285_011792 [Solanum tuberosum]|nr:hypothetical protein KY285_011792 [Solanum tuberosum]